MSIATNKPKGRRNWTRASIQRDSERFERAHSVPSGDGLPEGMNLEESVRCGLVSSPLPWDEDYEPSFDCEGTGAP